MTLATKLTVSKQTFDFLQLQFLTAAYVDFSVEIVLCCGTIFVSHCTAEQLLY